MSTPQQFHILMNANSATANTLGEEKIRQAVNDSQIPVASFDFLPQPEFGKKLEELVASPNPVLVGGGDGTIAMCSTLHLKQNKPFGIIPSGTMNLMARDLNLPLDLKECLEGYKNTSEIAVDVGDINNKYFLCCVSWGMMPKAAKFREKYRGLPHILLFPKLASYIMEQMDRAQKKTILMTLDGHKKSVRAGMLIVSNNLYDPESGIGSFRKNSLQDGLLGVYKISSSGFLNKARLLLKLSVGIWKNNPHIREYQARTVKIDTKRTADLVSIDGEPVEMNGPYNITVREKALKIIVPQTSIKAA